MNRAAFITIVVSGPITLALRSSFLVFAHRMVDMPQWAQRVLRQIPPAVLAALVLPAFVQPEGHLDLWQPRLAAGAVAAAVAFWKRSPALTLISGLVAVLAIDWLTR